MRNLLEFILNRLVNYPEDVRVEEDKQGELTFYKIHVNPEDMGRIIGKNGSVINAIRAIAKVRAIKENIHVRIDVAEVEQAEAEQSEA